MLIPGRSYNELQVGKNEIAYVCVWNTATGFKWGILAL